MNVDWITIIGANPSPPLITNENQFLKAAQIRLPCATPRLPSTPLDTVGTGLLPPVSFSYLSLQLLDLRLVFFLAIAVLL